MPIACPSLIGSSYPELCAAVDHYCERTSSAFDAEPVNALTNAAFLIGACIAWRIRSGRRGSEGRLVIALILTMALVGLGSFLVSYRRNPLDRVGRRPADHAVHAVVSMAGADNIF